VYVDECGTSQCVGGCKQDCDETGQGESTRHWCTLGWITDSRQSLPTPTTNERWRRRL